ncbi:MAG: hypothetical protein SVY10_07845 [Thermodesulfobacteriota bacterium]|nr:hypothetical protein [Thermodesulfobacteriota bacterium]
MKKKEKSQENNELERSCFYLDEAPCTLFKDYLTEEEETILFDIRAIQKKATQVKNRLKSLDRSETENALEGSAQGKSKEEERRFLQEELNELREKRKELNKQKEDAHHRKMVMLGHVKP